MLALEQIKGIINQDLESALKVTVTLIPYLLKYERNIKKIGNQTLDEYLKQIIGNKAF